MPLKTSSSKIRDALSGREPLCELAALPFTAYCLLCTQGNCQMQQEKAGGLAAQLTNAQEES
jgi:CO dehydrogenase/acetyl-CoA synthase alpha subunit